MYEREKAMETTAATTATTAITTMMAMALSVIVKMCEQYVCSVCVCVYVAVALLDPTNAIVVSE